MKKLLIGIALILSTFAFADTLKIKVNRDNDYGDAWVSYTFSNIRYVEDAYIKTTKDLRPGEFTINNKGCMLIRATSGKEFMFNTYSSSWWVIPDGQVE